jgi:phospholipid transport system substrate-binding protein
MNLFAKFLSSSFAALAFAVAAPAFAQEAADVVLKKAVDEVVSVVRSDKAIQAGDRKKVNDLVESKIVPYLNFERMTQDAMAQNWAKASADQKKQLVAEFRTLLIRTYSGALSSYKEGTVIKYKPNRNLGDGEVLVRSEIVQPGGEPIQLDYFMEKSGNGWKVFDINVLGARLVENYRGTFRSEINQSGIDGLIKSLASLNKSSAVSDAKKG